MKTLCLAVLVFGVGCVSVTARKAPGVSMSQYRTFAFYPTPANDETSINRSPAAEAAKNQISQDLQSRGLRPAQAGQRPDLLVAAHMKVTPQYDVIDYGPAWGYGWGWYGPYYTTASEWLQGTIIIDLIDPRTNQVVWRGTASSAVSNPDNPDPNKVAGAVNKVMARLPADMAAGYTPTHM